MPLTGPSRADKKRGKISLGQMLRLCMLIGLTIGTTSSGITFAFSRAHVVEVWQNLLLGTVCGIAGALIWSVVPLCRGRLVLRAKGDLTGEPAPAAMGPSRPDALPSPNVPTGRPPDGLT